MHTSRAARFETNSSVDPKEAQRSPKSVLQLPEIQSNPPLPIREDTMALASTNHTATLDALADIAAQTLNIALPESPQGKPFVEPTDTASSLLRAVRKSLNLTQREFGILLSPFGASPISPSVICQLESGLQPVPPLVVERAGAVCNAAQRLGEYLGSLPTSPQTDPASALKRLGYGCINELQPYLEAMKPGEVDGQLATEYLSIVTKRRQTTGGSRPGARGPYRKLSKLSARDLTAAEVDSPARINMAPLPIMKQVSGESQLSECASGRSTPSYASSYCSTPGTPSSSITDYDSTVAPDSRPGTPSGCAGVAQRALGGSLKRASDTNAEVMMALRQLQEQNEMLMQENKRLKAMMTPGAVYPQASAA